MAKPKPVQHRSKVAIKDLPSFFVKLNADGGEYLTRLALRWTILTMVRTEETRFAEWSEIEGLPRLKGSIRPSRYGAFRPSA